MQRVVYIPGAFNKIKNALLLNQFALKYNTIARDDFLFKLYMVYAGQIRRIFFITYI